MDAALGLEVTVGVVARHLERDRLDAGLVAVEHVELAHRKAHAFAEAGVHAVEHLRPVLRLGSARAGVEREDAVTAIVFAGHQRLQAKGFEILLEGGEVAADLLDGIVVVGLLGELHQHLDVVGACGQALEVLQPALDTAGLRGDLLRAVGVVPEAGRAHVLLIFDQLLAQVIDVQRFGRFGEHSAHLGQILLKTFHFNHAIYPSFQGAGSRAGSFLEKNARRSHAAGSADALAAVNRRRWTAPRRRTAAPCR